jgi:hypothetical protein
MFLYCSLSTKSSTFFYKLLLFPFCSIAVHRAKQQQGRPSIERERERDTTKPLSFRRMHEWPLILQKCQKEQQQKTFATS